MLLYKFRGLVMESMRDEFIEEIEGLALETDSPRQLQTLRELYEQLFTQVKSYTVVEGDREIIDKIRASYTKLRNKDK